MAQRMGTGMVDEAKRCFSAIDFRVANMLNLPVSGNYLAGIVAVYAIVHLDPSEISQLAKEFHRALKPTGYVLLAFHIGKQEIIRANKKIGENEIAADYVFHDYDYVVKCLEENGFELPEAFIRYPYRDVEYSSRRAYILAKKV